MMESSRRGDFPRLTPSSFRTTETRLAQACLLLVNGMRLQKEPGLVLPWMEMRLSEADAEGKLSRRLTDEELEEVCETFAAWDDANRGVPVEERERPRLRQGITIGG